MSKTYVMETWVRGGFGGNSFEYRHKSYPFTELQSMSDHSLAGGFGTTHMFVLHNPNDLCHSHAWQDGKPVNHALSTTPKTQLSEKESLELRKAEWRRRHPKGSISPGVSGHKSWAQSFHKEAWEGISEDNKTVTALSVEAVNDAEKVGKAFEVFGKALIFHLIKARHKSKNRALWKALGC